MLRRHIWRELRWRILIALPLVAAPAALIAWSYVARLRASSPSDPMTMSLLTYLDELWFQLPGASAVFLVAAIIVGANGTLLRPPADVSYMLALPVSRRRWLATHVIVSVASLVALMLVALSMFGIAAIMAPSYVAIGSLLLRSAAVLIAATAWICVSTAVVILVRRTAMAVVALVVLLAYAQPTRFRLAIPPQPGQAMLGRFDPWLFVDPRSWCVSSPLPSIVVSVALAIIALVIADRVLERRDL